MAPAERTRKYTKLLEQLHTSDQVCAELADANLARKDGDRSFIVGFLLGECRFTDPVAGLADFKSWLGNNSTVGPKVLAALKAAKASKAASEEAKYSLLEKLGLNPKNSSTKREVEDLYANIAVHEVTKVAVPYPPVDEWVAETPEIAAMWQARIERGKLHDDRGYRREIHILDPERLQYDLQPEESALFVDKVTGKLVMAVIRNFCRDQGVLDWLTDIILENVDARKSIRVCVPPSCCHLH